MDLQVAAVDPVVVGDDDGGELDVAVVEYAETDKIFTNPDDKRTEDYVTGKFG